MIPLGQIGLELLMGLGTALFAANLWVLLRPVMARWMKSPPPPPRRRPMNRIVVGMAAGLVVFAWALASLVARS